MGGITGNKITYIFGLVMIVFYLAAGGLLIFYDIFPDFPLWVRYGLGILFLLYGLFRLWRVIKNRNSI